MRLTLPPPKPCPECGGDPVYHGVEYLALLMDSVGLPAYAFFSDTLGKLVGGSSGFSLGGFYRLLERLQLGEFRDEPDDKTLLLDRVLWEEAARRGIRMREFRFLGIPKATFTAQFPDGREIDFGGVPFPPRKDATVWWIDTKSILKQKFREFGIPVPKGGSASNAKEAQKLFATLKAPVVVKPSTGSASRHTTMHIETGEELERAFRVAKQISPSVIVEEELVGAVYRPTLVDGKLIATLRRDQPCVWGDGKKSVSELIAEANAHPGRQGPYFSRMELNDAAYAELAFQKLLPEDVPAKGRRVTLHPKINWSVGGTTTDVSDAVHPDNRALFERIAEVLRAPLVGIDFIIEDISRSWNEQERCGVIECNSMPYFDNHHLPFDGKPRDVAGPIWDLMEKTSTI